MRQALLTLATAGVLAAAPARADDTLGSRVDAVTERARGAIESAKERVLAGADEATQTVRKHTGEATEAAGQKAKEAGEYGDSLGDQVSAIPGAVAHRVSSAMSAWFDRSKQAASNAITAARSEARDLLMDAAAALDRQNAAAKQEARSKQWDAVKARYALDGARPSEALSEELRDHAYRVARLARVRTLAEAADDEAAVKRSDRLLEVEHARHRRRIEALREDHRATDGDDP